MGTRRKIVSRLARNGDYSPLAGVFVLPVASPGTVQIPTVSFDHTDDFPDLHSSKLTSPLPFVNGRARSTETLPKARRVTDYHGLTGKRLQVPHIDSHGRARVLRAPIQRCRRLRKHLPVLPRAQLRT